MPATTAEFTTALLDEIDHDACKFSYTEPQVDGTEVHHVFTTDAYGEPSDPYGVANQITTHLEDGESLLDAVRQTRLFEEFDDPYWNGHPRVYEYQVMLRTFLYAELRGFAFRSHVAEFLDDNPNVALDLGFDFEKGTLGVRTPHQTVVNECWNDRFNEDVREYIAETVEYVHEWARENETFIETTELSVPAEDEDDGELSKAEIRRIVNELMRHILPNYSFDRGDNKTHRKNLFFEVLAHCSLTSSSVYGGGETFEWSKCSDEAPPSGRTYFDHIQSLSPAQMMKMFDEAVESQFEAASKLGLYDEALPIAVDVTTWESDAFGKRVSFESISDPEDDDLSKSVRRETKKAIEKWKLQPLVGEDPEKIRTADFDDPELVELAESIPDVVRYVHGTKSGDDFCYAWEFAAACIAHPTCPMMFAVKPLERKDDLEEHVEEFIDRAQELIVVDQVYMDAAYAQVPVFNKFRYPGRFRTADVFDMDYVMNIRENDRVTNAVLEEKPGDGEFVSKMADNDEDVTVVREFGQYSQDAGAWGHTTLLGLPKRGVETVEDPVKERVAFCTNRAKVDVETAIELVNGPDGEDDRRGYGNRWLIESGFKKVKEFLAYTKTGDADTRLFYFLYATLLFNCWMLVDRTIKKRKGVEYVNEPELKAKTFAVIVANFLRPVT